jgi:DNA invertase Pin-like site-specific DNA recombinase
MEPGTRVFGYVRKSIAENGNGHSLDAQTAAIERECKHRAWTLVEVIRDDGYSGRDTSRPGLHGALRRIAAKEASALIASKLDRISRSVIDFGILLEWFDRADAALVALDVNIDTSTPSGLAMANVMVTMGQWERQTGALRTKDALAARRAKGLPISRPSVVDDKALTSRIVALRADGLTLQAIADTLNSDGVATLRGAPQWTTSSVRGAAGYKRPKKQRVQTALPPLRSSRRAA